jgi:hypothetical protein
VDDPLLTILGLVVGVSLLYLGSRIRSKARQRLRPPKGGES